MSTWSTTCRPVAGQPGRGPGEPRPRVTFHQLDIRSPEPVDLIDGAGRKWSSIWPPRPTCGSRSQRPIFDAEVNVIGTLRVLEGARPGRPARWSSPPAAGPSTATPIPADLPVKESIRIDPCRPTGCPRRSCGDYLAAYRELHYLEFSALALANVYGPRQDPHGEAGVVAIFAGRLLEASPSPSSATAPRPGTSCSSTTWSTPSPGPRTEGGGLVLNIGTGAETCGQRALRSHGRSSRRSSIARRLRARAGRASCSAVPSTRAGPPSTWVEALDRPGSTDWAPWSPTSSAFRVSS